mmetsp:Transcript_19262/g.53919  ORF Transcript_19262/g.53919 Transcript_19262/m.53919 type:complete len:442 (+) Transcript_19262:195-1520(+)|eukprot:CAMPEP_0202353008 /NCGR_PEP_ID=MMETSP1126-20121109/8958_1 /ASSEMBLY_ACC=CAM_ASM_000457 /TAXON_ID=3047 /ORGANISM="Dunaliella tertiolecta, Strain CCMP1320" /LENGTH=441 /DNA_ID=CAMNT_0048945305 /DNA_START=127 /DNA_END=1452 /DNA_ORIENTATION=-
MKTEESDMEAETGLDTENEAAPMRTSTQGGVNGIPRPRRSHRKKGEKKLPAVTAMAWLCVDANGSSALLQSDKWRVAEKLGIQARDLRLLDPQLSTTASPCAILCRDRSIIVNLEHIKAIITVDKVLLVNYGHDEAGTKFAEELGQRLANPGAASKFSSSMKDLQQSVNSMEPHSQYGTTNRTMEGSLPFELRALECCLESLAASYDQLTTDLEVAAYPLLDGMAIGVTPENLDQVRRNKNKLVRLTTRVQTAREVLEKFLNNHDDMHDFNITANRDRENALQEERARSLQEANAALGGDVGEALMGHSAPSSVSVDSSIVENEVADVEMLLEAYYMHIDAAFNRLETLNEYIKDTEDMVSIKLDTHRNALITVDLVLTAFSACLAIITAISGIFGMNLESGLETAPHVFQQVTLASSLGSLLVFVIFLLWAYKRGLLVFA